MLNILAVIQNEHFWGFFHRTRLEKNIEVLFKNGYITLNYLSNVLDIMEKQCLTNFDNIKGVWNNMADISRAYNEVYSKMLYSHP